MKFKNFCYLTILFFFQHQQQKNSSLESDTYQKQALLGSGFPTPSPGLNRQPSSKSRRLMSLESFLDSISLLEKSESSNQKSTDKWVRSECTNPLV